MTPYWHNIVETFSKEYHITQNCKMSDLLVCAPQAILTFIPFGKPSNTTTVLPSESQAILLQCSSCCRRCRRDVVTLAVRGSFVACMQSRGGLVGCRRGWERWWRYVDARGEEGVGWVGWQGWQGTWQGSTGSIGLTHCELLTSVRD